MRKWCLIGSLVLASCFAMMAACAFEPGADRSEVSTAAEVETAAALDPNALGGVIEAASNCAHVLFCDVPNSSVGTLCKQDGCSLAEAKQECLGDLAAIGCSLHCPAYIRTSNGDVPICCGGSLCGASAKYCGPTGACCDDVHFNGACPPS